MSRFEGTLARKLDFGEVPAACTGTSGQGRAALRVAPRRAAGPDKYQSLERRRRRAQIRARHLLDVMDTAQ